MLNFLKSFYAFLEDPINYIFCNFQLVIRMFSTILMPTKIGPGFGPGSQALVPASIPSPSHPKNRQEVTRTDKSCQEPPRTDKSHFKY